MTFANLPAWSPPLLQWILVQFVTGLAVAFTHAQSSVRPLAAVIAALLGYGVQRDIREAFAETRFTGPVVATCWVNVLNALDLLVLSRVSYEGQMEWELQQEKHSQMKGEEGKKNTNETPWKRLIWSISIAFNYRRIHTPWQIAQLPSSTSVSRFQFLIYSGLKLCLCLSLVQLLTTDADNTSLTDAISHLPDSATGALLPFPKYGASQNQLLLQILFTISFGIITRATIVAAYTLAAMGSVASGLSDPFAWPPVAGSLADAWTLRRFWGISWHQTLRKLLTSTADFLATILGVAPSSALARWVRVVFAFTASGAIHSLMDMAFGVAPGKSGAMWFFGLQIVGLMGESVIATMYGSCSGDGFGNGPGKRPEMWKRVVGYIWVLGFLIWATPVWTNSILVALYKDGQRIPSPFLGSEKLDLAWLSGLIA